MTETMAGPTSTPGPGAFASAAAEPGGNASGTPEQKIAWLQARLDAVAEKSDDTLTALLLTQVSDKFSGSIADILPLTPFLDSGGPGGGPSGGPGMGGGNSVLPLALALTLSDGGSQDIARILPFFLLFDGGGAGMGGGNNMLPLVLALTLSDDGSGGGGAGGGGAGGPDTLIQNLEKRFDALREDLKQVRETREEVSTQERDDGGGGGGAGDGGAGGPDTLIESLEETFDVFREDLKKMKADMKRDQKELSNRARAIEEKVDNLTQAQNPQSQ
jgi:hypothetical protein